MIWVIKNAIGKNAESIFYQNVKINCKYEYRFIMFTLLLHMNKKHGSDYQIEIMAASRRHTAKDMEEEKQSGATKACFMRLRQAF